MEASDILLVEAQPSQRILGLFKNGTKTVSQYSNWVENIR